MSRAFYITDVFCEGSYSGNQLATIVDTKDLSDREMQQIARAFNFAETTFVMGGSKTSGYDVRIFTPEVELPFAGHPTLGTGFLIRHLNQSNISALTLNLEVGSIPVSFSDDGIVWMRQMSPDFVEAPGKQLIAERLGLNVDDLDPSFEPETVSTGLPFLLVPLKSLAALKRCNPVSGFDTGVLVFTREVYLPEHDIAARMFAHALGLVEDAATGSANGCLAAYAVEHHYLGGNQISARVGQGFEIGRPSTLHLNANKHGAEFEIYVGGKVKLVASGQWHL